jgi:plastocyanin
MMIIIITENRDYALNNSARIVSVDLKFSRMKKSSLQAISYVVPLIIVVVLIIAFAAGYFAGTGTGSVTKYVTLTSTTTVSTSATLNPTCVTLGNCPSSYVYIAYGASKNTGGLVINPENITVIVGVNNTVTWENLDTVTQTITGANNLFTSPALAPGHSFSYTFTNTGTFGYSSPTYPWVKGFVTVLPALTTSAPGSNPNDNY